MASGFLALSYHTKSYANTYRNSDIGNSDYDFSTRNHDFFSDNFPPEICRIPESEAEIPIPDPPARGAVPAEFPTKVPLPGK